MILDYQGYSVEREGGRNMTDEHLDKFRFCRVVGIIERLSPTREKRIELLKFYLENYRTLEKGGIKETWVVLQSHFNPEYCEDVRARLLQKKAGVESR